MITLQQLKDLANSIESKAKNESNVDIRIGLYKSVADIWSFINQQIEIKQS